MPALVLASEVHAQAWPARAIRLVVPFPAGGATDLLARAIAPHLNANLPYNVEADFTPVAQVANATNILLVPKDLPVNSMRELIAYIKARPGQLNFATSGNGTIVHLTTEAFKARAGLFIVHIPYRGTALAIPDLVSGKVQLLFDSLVSAIS